MLIKRTFKPLRWHLVIIFLSFFFENLLADNVINYSYDSSGNRILSERAIIIRGTDKGSGRKGNPMTDDLSAHKITIFPNPTDGLFSVEISDIEIAVNASITIFSTSGKEIYTIKEPDAVNDIDITDSPNGMYILKIIVDDETSIWKVIKY